MGSKSRTKGATAEREVVAILRRNGPWPDAERDLDQVRGHDTGRDIINTYGVCIQVKRRARVAAGVIESGLDEAFYSAEEHEYPVCVHRSDRGTWRVTMTFTDWCELCWEGAR
jgi:hypothetical protein